MDRRKTPRVQVQLPVQIWGVDAHGQAFTDTAKVTNMSSTGLVVRGLRRKLRAGDILDIRLDAETAQYRISWIAGVYSPHAGDMGMRRVAPEAFAFNSVLSCCAQAAGTC